MAMIGPENLYLRCESYRSESDPGLLYRTKDGQTSYYKLRYFRVDYTWLESTQFPFGFDGTGVVVGRDTRFYHGASLEKCSYQPEAEIKITCGNSTQAELKKTVIEGKNYYQSITFKTEGDYTYLFNEEECQFHPFQTIAYQKGDVIPVGYLRQAKNPATEIYLNVDSKGVINVWSYLEAEDTANYGMFGFMDGKLNVPMDQGVFWGYYWPIDEAGFEKDRTFYDFNHDGVMDELKVERTTAPMDVLSAYQLLITIR